MNKECKAKSTEAEEVVYSIPFGKRRNPWIVLTDELTKRGHLAEILEIPTLSTRPEKSTTLALRTDNKGRNAVQAVIITPEFRALDAAYQASLAPKVHYRLVDSCAFGPAFKQMLKIFYWERKVETSDLTTNLRKQGLDTTSRHWWRGRYEQELAEATTEVLDILRHGPLLGRTGDWSFSEETLTGMVTQMIDHPIP